MTSNTPLPLSDDMLTCRGFAQAKNMAELEEMAAHADVEIEEARKFAIIWDLQTTPLPPEIEAEWEALNDELESLGEPREPKWDPILSTDFDMRILFEEEGPSEDDILSGISYAEGEGSSAPTCQDIDWVIEWEDD